MTAHTRTPASTPAATPGATPGHPGRSPRLYTPTGADGRTYRSGEQGTLGGHRPGRLYGRLDCPSALRAITRGHYVRRRVFFADEATAIAAGHRPCAACLPEEYTRWKANRETADTP